MKGKEENTVEPVASRKLPWRKLALQKLLTVDQTSNSTVAGVPDGLKPGTS